MNMGWIQISEGDMDYNNFYVLNYQERRDDIKLKLVNPIKDKIAFIKGKDRNSVPLQLSFLNGRRASDIFTLGTIGIWGYSPRIIETIRSTNATGIEFFPLKIDGPEEVILSLQNYYGAFITGNSGPLLKEKSKYKLLPAKGKPEKNVYWQIGRFFDLETWDGSDFFNPGGTLYTFVTSRIVQLLSAIKPSSVSFTPISDIENLIPQSMIPNAVLDMMGVQR
jgi:hypothetical protein